MSAHPIIPGRLYLVRHNGRKFAVRAKKGCDAIRIAFAELFAGKVTP